ncbi:hypothetical protein [Marispirochaeta aestuarii]|uniref:Abi-alpha family protein n=1 Tax=Marispirochaeta aestuarii TaxID=1963862 RepID=UPI002ABD3D22|nr:hypothetical protein [Marispirochaeta aestuarii]
MSNSQQFKKNQRDIAHSIIKSALSTVPFAGGALSELFVSIFQPPIQKRQSKWIESITAQLLSLENRIDGFDLNSLADKPSFISVVMNATSIAIRNHQDEKLRVLSNAILNTALDYDLEDDVRQLFLAYIDTLSPSHIRILKFLHNPKEWGIEHKVDYPKIRMCGTAHMLLTAFPEFIGHDDLYTQYVNDLNTKGLIWTKGENLQITLKRNQTLMSRTTELGQQFLGFIEEP